MRTLFIAAASALFFAALTTELFMRLWPGEYFALLVLSFVMLLASGLLNLRLAGPFGAARSAARRGQERNRQRPPRKGRGEGRSEGRGEGRGERRQDSRKDRKANARTSAADTRQAEPAPSGPRETGTVKWFNRSKGFGFIIRESGEEIFVHQRSIRLTGEGDDRRRPNLKDGQSVNFVVAEREKGLQAEDVVPAE